MPAVGCKSCLKTDSFFSTWSRFIPDRHLKIMSNTDSRLWYMNTNQTSLNKRSSSWVRGVGFTSIWGRPNYRRKTCTHSDLIRKELISTKETEDGSTCTTHFNTVKGTYFRFWVIGIQLRWKDGQHGLAHFSHPRDQLGLDRLRILKRRHKHYWGWGCFQTGLLLCLVSKPLTVLLPFWNYFF